MIVDLSLPASLTDAGWELYYCSYDTFSPKGAMNWSVKLIKVETMQVTRVHYGPSFAAALATAQHEAMNKAASPATSEAGSSTPSPAPSNITIEDLDL